MKSVYIVREYYTTIKDKNFEYTNGCAVDYDLSNGSTNICTEDILRTENKEEALAKLAERESYVHQSRYHSNEYEVTEYWVNEEIWDGDDFYDDAGIIAFAKVKMDLDEDEEE